MKKILSLLLSLLLLFSLSATAFAEENPVEYHWMDTFGQILDTFAGHGNLLRIEEVDALVWLPDIFIPVTLTEEDEQNGTIGIFVMEDSDAFVLFNYSEIPDITLDSLYTYYSQNNHTVEKVSVNNIPAILDRDEENNTLTLTYQTQEGKFFQVIFSPVSDEHFASLFDLVISSIQPDFEAESAEPAVPTNPVSGLISK